MLFAIACYECCLLYLVLTVVGYSLLLVFMAIACYEFFFVIAWYECCCPYRFTNDIDNRLL